jgi:hypothetical protein
MSTLLFKRIIATKYKEVKSGFILAQSSKEGYGSRGTVFPMMLINNNNKI